MPAGGRERSFASVYLSWGKSDPVGGKGTGRKVLQRAESLRVMQLKPRRAFSCDPSVEQRKGGVYSGVLV